MDYSYQAGTMLKTLCHTVDQYKDKKVSKIRQGGVSSVSMSIDHVDAVSISGLWQPFWPLRGEQHWQHWLPMWLPGEFGGNVRLSMLVSGCVCVCGGGGCHCMRFHICYLGHAKIMWIWCVCHYLAYASLMSHNHQGQFAWFGEINPQLWTFTIIVT